ncbi:MAG: hypothetical protein AB7W16_15345, partial [Candidatus Obscuribacterales bacterium]
MSSNLSSIRSVRRFLSRALPLFACLAVLATSRVDSLGSKVFKEVDQALASVTFDTNGGLVRCNLPADLRAGDTISGTIQMEPDGSNDSYKQRSLKKLNDYIVFVGKHEVYARLGTFRFTVPPDTTSLEIRLSNKKGANLGSETIAVAPATSEPEPASYKVSSFVEANKPVAITGDFPGDFRMNEVTVNDQAATPLAQSPRSLVFLPPENMSGTLKLRLKEGKHLFRGEFTALSVSLSMVTNKVERGKSHSLLVRVVGLKDNAPSVMVKVQNLTPQIVNLEGGDVQSV